MTSLASRLRKQHGFTLIEMAIVLVIIGLIVAAVSVGKDAQRNAEYNKIFNKFLSQWGQAYNQYYERSGVVLLDDTTNPTGEVNSDGTEVKEGTLTGAMDDIGIKYPVGNGTGKEYQYVYYDHQGVPHTLAVSFKFCGDGTTGTACDSDLAGNIMIISKITSELAKRFDAAIDGVPDGQKGNFRSSTGDAWADYAAAGDTGAVAADYTANWKMTQ